MTNFTKGVSGCQLCMGGAGNERCYVTQTATSFGVQVGYFLNQTNTGGITMSEPQIRSALSDLRSKIALCQNKGEVEKARQILNDYLQRVNSAK